MNDSWKVYTREGTTYPFEYPISLAVYKFMGSSCSHSILSCLALHSCSVIMLFHYIVVWEVHIMLCIGFSLFSFIRIGIYIAVSLEIMIYILPLDMMGVRHKVGNLYSSETFVSLNQQVFILISLYDRKNVASALCYNEKSLPFSSLSSSVCRRNCFCAITMTTHIYDFSFSWC